MKYSKPEVDGETAIKLWCEEHSNYAKEQVILNNIGLVGIVMKHLNLDLQDEDLFQTGVAGLIIAINTFDRSKGYKFSAYATTVVRNEILGLFNKKRIAPTMSLEKSLGEDGEDGTRLENVLSSGERFEDLSILKIDLEKSMSCLKEREKNILIHLACGETQSSIAKNMGMTRQNVKRILRIIQKKIRVDEER